MNARVAVLSIVLSGCSFVFVRGAPDPEDLPRGARVECTNGDLWPMIDSIAVGASALGLTLAATGPKMQQTDNTLIGASIVSLFVYGISAIYGFVRTSSCQDALTREAKMQRTNRFRIFRPEPPAPPPPPPEAVPASTTEPDTASPDGGQP